MSAADELQHLKEEVIPLLAMTCYTLGRLAEMPDDTEVDRFQMEADSMMWWHRIDAKAQDR